MENITCNGCKAYKASYDGIRHDCQLGFSIVYIGMEKYIESHLYGPKGKCPRPLTEERYEQIIFASQKTTNQ
jgi:hypothetical protein